MKRIKVEEIKDWNIAKKTKNIKAKPLISIMVDKSVLSKFLIDTLEGKEPLGDGSIICIGEYNDIWQQMPKNLIAKYNVIDVDNDGWMICEPRIDNSVNWFEISHENLPFISTIDTFIGEEPFYIRSQWGEKTSEGMIQRASFGDFICQNREDNNDFWIVKRKIFMNTYNIISYGRI